VPEKLMSGLERAPPPPSCVEAKGVKLNMA